MSCWCFLLWNSWQPHFPNKAQDLLSQNQPHRRHQNWGKSPWVHFQTLHRCCCLSAAFLPSVSHLCNGTGREGKFFPSSSSRGIHSPVQWPNSLSPDQSGLASISKITPDDTPGGLSTQLMIEYSLYSKSQFDGYDRTVHRANTARVCSVGTVRRDWVILSNCFPHLSTLSGQNIEKHQCDFSILIVLYLL